MLAYTYLLLYFLLLGKMPSGYVDLPTSGVRIFISPSLKDSTAEQYFQAWEHNKDFDGPNCIRIKRKVVPETDKFLTFLPSDTADVYVQISTVLVT